MPFEYLAPANIEEAISLLGRYGAKANVIAGGTELMVKIRNKVIKPKYVVDISGIPGLDYINLDERHGLTIGAMATIRSICLSPLLQQKFPVISKAASQLGSVAIRNVCTIGGNLCNGAPSAETAPVLIGLSAKARIIGPEGERVIPLEDLFVSPGATTLAKGELLVEIQVPLPEKGSNIRGTYFKHALRGTIDPAMVSVAVIASMDLEHAICSDIKIVLGAVAPTPMRAYRAEEILRNKKVSNDMITRCGEVAADESRPISDVRASAQYRKEMVRVFTRRALEEVTAVAD